MSQTDARNPKSSCRSCGKYAHRIRALECLPLLLYKYSPQYDFSSQSLLLYNRVSLLHAQRSHRIIQHPQRCNQMVSCRFSISCIILFIISWTLKANQIDEAHFAKLSYMIISPIINIQWLSGWLFNFGHSSDLRATPQGARVACDEHLFIFSCKRIFQF